MITEIEKKIAEMTLEEKAGLCSGGDFWHTKAINRLNIPKMLLTDGPHGLRRQEGEADHLGLNKSVPSTCFPAGVTSASSWDKNLLGQIGDKIGVEALHGGVGVVLGPAINIKRNPLCGRNFEYFSEDPFLAGTLASSYIQGVQKNGIAACPKHFVANNQEYLRMLVDSVIDERALREIYLRPFEYAIKEGKAKTIMSSYNRINGEYANENKHLLQDILTTEWGFNGVVVTDWGACNDRVQGLICGNQLEMPNNSGETDQEIIDAVHKGFITESFLDKQIQPLLKLILETNQATKQNTTYSKDDHHDFARTVAEQSMVLLKNEDNILPLPAKQSVAVIGSFAYRPRYQGAGSSIINPTKLETPLEELKRSNLNVIGFAQGYERYGKDNKELENKARILAKSAEIVIVFLGLNESTEVEGLDRKDMKLPLNQQKLLSAIHQVNPNIIVVLSGGAPVEMDWDYMAKAVLNSYLSGQAGGSAIANIITGTVNPSGKLAETYPLSYEDIPSSKYFLDGQKTAEYKESIFVGYRYFDTNNIAVKYPFGYGLSYTTFEYSNLTHEDNAWKFTVKNTGNRDGSEIAQLYIACEKSNFFRAKKELKGYEKVFLKKGEEKSVTIILDDTAFTVFDTTTNKWIVEKGSYQILICASVLDIRLSDTISILGEGSTKSSSTSIPSYFSADIKDISDKEFEQLLGRTIPPKYWDRNEKIGLNSSVAESGTHKGFGRTLCRLIKFLEWYTRKNYIRHAAVKVAYDMPYRSLGRMTDGVFNMEMVDAILVMINDGFFKGLKLFLKAKKNMKEREIVEVKL